ncbi:hypothetical protein [Micromonospora sp. NPDC047730]|uniref:hypothetical protein n=1 Tax=Micromonospora sp. NPDC047730 TaxID=3364253 RepID=UPI00371DE12B
MRRARIPAHVVEAWSVLPDRQCPCRCGQRAKIVCEDGWRDIGSWLSDEVSKAPLDMDLLTQVLIYWSPASERGAPQEQYDAECDRLEAELDLILLHIIPEELRS